MAIDTKSLTEVITEFRALQSKDAISPDSLGYILQRIVDLLATAGTSETISKITSLLDGFKAAGQAITALSQGQSDRNHIYANKSTVNLATGAVASSSGIFIQQATTERAGAMRAQQVIDLNAAKKGVTDLQTQVRNIDALVTKLQEAITGSASEVLGSKANFSVIVEDGLVRVRGIADLITAGCVPYIFRHTRKRNQYHEKQRTEADRTKKYCSKRKGWNLWGSRHAVRIVDGIVEFSLNNKSELIKEALGFARTPTALVHVHKNKAGLSSIGWGRSTILLHDPKDANKPRMIRLRFAIAFGQPYGPGRVRVTPDLMATELVEFSVVYNAPKKTWHFSR